MSDEKRGVYLPRTHIEMLKKDLFTSLEQWGCFVEPEKLHELIRLYEARIEELEIGITKALKRVLDL